MSPFNSESFDKESYIHLEAKLETKSFFDQEVFI